MNNAEGPFKKYTHTHIFESLSDGGIRVRDSVDYVTSGGLLGFILTAKAIERELKWIYDYRREKLAQLLNASAELQRFALLRGSGD